MNDSTKKIDLIQVFLVFVSIVAISYSFCYLFNYYNENNLLLHFPQSLNNYNEKLQPNEIGDSIGGILNPIIAFTGAILTFLAFYIQYKANLTQKDLFNQGLKNSDEKAELNKLAVKSDLEIKHKVNLRILSALINSMLKYYQTSGKFLQNFINLEKSNPLGTNIFNFTTNSSYANFQKLDFLQIYNSIVYQFSNSTDNWEAEFIEVLNYLDFYQNMIAEFREKYLTHVKKKYEVIKSISQNLEDQMPTILLDNVLKDLPTIKEYLRIVLNKDELLNDISPEKSYNTDFEELRVKFFIPFINELLSLYKSTENSKYREILEIFAKMNKQLGNEKRQSEKFIQNLENKHNMYFASSSKYFTKIKEFQNKIKVEQMAIG